MAGAKKAKKDSSSSNTPKSLVLKLPKGLATHISDGRRSISSKASSIVNFIKPRFSVSEKNNKNIREQKPQLPKLEESVKSTRKMNLKDWILSSPSLHAPASSTTRQSSGRIHPSSEEIVEATTPEMRPRDGFCLEGSKFKSKNDDDQEVEKDASGMRQSGKIEKRVRFRLPQVVDIFMLDSSDGYYFSN